MYFILFWGRLLRNRQCLLPCSSVSDVGRMKSPAHLCTFPDLLNTEAKAVFFCITCYFLLGSPRDSPWGLGRAVIGKDTSERVRIWLRGHPHRQSKRMLDYLELTGVSLLEMTFQIYFVCLSHCINFNEWYFFQWTVIVREVTCYSNYSEAQPH